MICKTCGMDSKTAGTCSWCGASLAAPGETPVETKPERARPVIREEPEPEVEETAVEIGTVPSLHSLRAESKPSAPSTLVPASEASHSPSVPHVVVTSARKMAPPVPAPGGKPRTPAPAAPPPASRAVSSTTGKLPSLNNLPNAPVSTPPTPAHAPLASLQEQADAMFVPSAAAGSALSASAPPTAEAGVASLLAPATKTLSAESTAAPVAPLAPSVVSASAETIANPETAIGTGVTPAKSAAPAPSATPPITERQKRAAVEAAMAESLQSPTELLGRYLGVFAVILIVTGVLAHLLPRFYIIPMVIAMFVATMLLPIMRVTPWVEEDGEDLIWFIVLTLVFGPLVALIIYGVVAAFRQSFNASVMGGLAVAALLRIVAEASAGNVSSVGQLFSMTSPFAGLQRVDSGIFKLLLRNWSGFAALAGWYAASSFHKEDE